MSDFACTICGKIFTIHNNLKRHVKTIHGDVSSENCVVCGKVYRRKDNLRQHMLARHSPNFNAIEPHSDSSPHDSPRSKKVKHSEQNHSADESKIENLEKKIAELLNELKEQRALIAGPSHDHHQRRVDINNDVIRSSEADAVERAERVERDQREIDEIQQILLHEDFVDDFAIVDDSVLCECGASIKQKSIGRHKTTRDHRLRFMANGQMHNVDIIECAFKHNVVKYKIDSETKLEIRIEEFMKAQKNTVESLLNLELNAHENIKVQIKLIAQYENVVNVLNADESAPLDNEREVKEVYFQPAFEIFCKSSDFSEFYESQTLDIIQKSEDFDIVGSGWAINHISHMILSVNRFSPLNGSSYIELPETIWRRKAIINIRNNDDFCFIYSILVKNFEPDEKSLKTDFNYYKQHMNTLNLNGISFPMHCKDIAHFERLNPSYSINVFGLERKKKKDKSDELILFLMEAFESSDSDDSDADESDLKRGEFKVKLLRITKTIKENHVNLLMLTEGKKSHFCFIKDLGRLLQQQITKHRDKIFVCDSCLLHFSTEWRKTQHISKNDCLHKEVILPIAKPYVKFEAIEKQMEMKFIIYADIECLLSKIVQPSNSSESHHDIILEKTVELQKHEPCSYAYNIVCSKSVPFDQFLQKPRLYRGEEAMKHFMINLRSDVAYIYTNFILPKQPMELSNEEKYLYAAQEHCHICKAKFQQPVEGKTSFHTKCRDHCHISGKFRGAACMGCNSRYQEGKFIPVFFHNLRYDASCFIRDLAKFKNDKIKVLPLNKEKYISFSQKIEIEPHLSGKKRYGEIRFLDSFRFLPSGLDTLAKNLKDCDFEQVKHHFPNKDDYSLLTQKGVYPYSWFDSVDKFVATSLPAKSEFFNLLSSEDINDDQYDHAVRVFHNFKCQNMGEFSDIYLLTDVLILSDVFENFRRLSQKIYGLECCHYFTTAGLSWDAMLKMSNITLDLFTDFDMVSMIRKGIRGGVSQINIKEIIANNSELRSFNCNEPELYCEYYDANNLYGEAMSKSLPYSDFSFVQDIELENVYRIAINSPPDSATGYILEIDVDRVDDALHDLHKDLPFLPVNKIPPSAKHSKLILDFSKKENYVIHYQNLQQVLRHGLKVSRVHRILKFKQKNWLKDYIDFNTSQRSVATSIFEKDFYKLLNNCIYGKCVQRSEHYKTVHLVTQWEAKGKKICAKKLINKPNFHSISVFDEEFCAVEMSPLKVKMDKPSYAGFAILELSKYKMYDFFYEYLKPKFGGDLSLGFTDTDSFLVECTTSFKNKIRSDLNEYFDTSDFDEEMLKKHNFTLVNKKVLGMFKDECNGFPIAHFVGLKSKCYALKIQFSDCDTTKARLKGVSSSTVKKYNLDPYLHTLKTTLAYVSTMTRIKFKLHNITTVRERKTAITIHDDKRFAIPDTFRTLPWYHKDIKEVYGFEINEENELDYVHTENEIVN